MQAFVDAIDITTVFTGSDAYYLPPVDKVYMPPITRFQNSPNYYGVWAHELGHATKARHRLNRDYGLSRFGNTAYAQRACDYLIARSEAGRAGEVDQAA